MTCFYYISLIFRTWFRTHFWKVVLNTILNTVLNMVFNMVFNTVLNTVSNMVLNMVLHPVLNTVWTLFWTWFWTWFWTRTQVGTPILFPRRNSLASVSILPVLSRLILDFSLRSSFVRVTFQTSIKLVNILHLKLSHLIMLLIWDYW